MATTRTPGVPAETGSERLEKALQADGSDILAKLLDGRLLVRVARAALIAEKKMQDQIRIASFEKEKERFPAFQQDVEKIGIVEPLQVFPLWQGDKALLKLFSGFNRFACSKAEMLDVIVHPFLAEEEAIKLGIKLNHLRSQAEQIDMVSLIMAKASASQIASICGVSQKTVERWSDLVSFHLYEYVKEGLLKQSEGLRLVGLLREVPEKNREATRLQLTAAMEMQRIFAKKNVDAETKRAAERKEKPKEKLVKLGTHFSKGVDEWEDAIRKAASQEVIPEFPTGDMKARAKALKEYEEAAWKDGIPRIGVEGKRWSKLTAFQLNEIHRWASTLAKWSLVQVNIKDLEEGVTSPGDQEDSTPDASKQQVTPTETPTAQAPLNLKRKKAPDAADEIGEVENPDNTIK